MCYIGYFVREKAPVLVLGGRVSLELVENWCTLHGRWFRGLFLYLLSRQWLSSWCVACVSVEVDKSRPRTTNREDRKGSAIA